MLLLSCDKFECCSSAYAAEKNPSWIFVKDFEREYHFCSAKCAESLFNPRFEGSRELIVRGFNHAEGQDEQSEPGQEL